MTQPKRNHSEWPSRPLARPLDVQTGEVWALESGSSRARLDLLSLVPLLAILALVGVVAGVLWTLERRAQQDAQTQIATDALWVEQTLRFQLSVDEDMLTKLALDHAGGVDRGMLDNSARLHIATNPEMLSVIWYDAAGDITRALPGAGAIGNDDFVDQLARLNGSGVLPTRPVYSQPDVLGHITMGLPLPDGAGFVTATLSLNEILNRHIPWWIAENYGVRIAVGTGRVLAERQSVVPAPGALQHRISFEPPLPGTFIEIAAYEPPSKASAPLDLALILGLALFSVLALVVLYRSGQRRRAVERQLLNETAFRRAMEESLTVGLRAKDHDGRILYVNSAFCKLVGHEARDLVGAPPPMPYWVLDRLEETRARHRLLAEGGPIMQTFETRFRHSNGHEIDVQVYEAPLIDAAGKHRGWMGSVIDMTETKAAARRAREQEDAMERTGRLVMLGEMATTLAHELNQPLAAIASYAAGLRNLLERGDVPAKLVQEASAKLAQQAERAGQIIRRIQDLVKKRSPAFSDLDLGGLITETANIMASEARAQKLKLTTRLYPVPPVAADRVLLGQVVANLIRNAIEAMSEHRHGDEVIVTLWYEESQAFIEVADQGPGVSSALEGRLFDAFATTKDGGMGMGLAICRSIIEAHRGQLLLMTRESDTSGATFRVALPLSAQGSERPKDESTAALPATRGQEP